MKNSMLFLMGIFNFSITSFAKDEITTRLPEDEKIECRQNLQKEEIVCSDTKSEINLMRDLQVPEKTKKIYLEEQDNLEEYAIIKRFLFCLQTKWEEIGHDAMSDTPGSIRELHYIITGEISDSLDSVSKDLAGKDFYRFYDLFMNINSYPLTDYEKEQIMQNAERRYTQEHAKEILWKKIKMKKQD